MIGNKTIHYDNAGKCVDVIDGNTIQVYGVGKVQLVQVKTPQLNESGFSNAKKFVEEKCLGKTVYLDIDDKQPQDKYGRTLAIVYTDTDDINKELIDRDKFLLRRCQYRRYWCINRGQLPATAIFVCEEMARHQ